MPKGRGFTAHLVKMDAEKGAWYQVGVNMSNPTDEDIVVYVRAEGVTVRIASYALTLENQADQTNDATSLALLSEAQVYTQNPTENSPDTITFIGTIVENTIDTLTPQILVETMGQEIPYEYVWFELPGDEADWGTKINAVVSITCTGQFSEIEMDSFDSKLVYGTLLSITRVGSQPIIIPSASPAMESQRPEEDKPQRDHCYP